MDVMWLDIEYTHEKKYVFEILYLVEKNNNVAFTCFFFLAQIFHMGSDKI